MQTTLQSPDELSATTSVPVLMTVGEVAEHLRVSEMTVYRMITARQIAASKIGRGWRIAADDLTDYLDTCRIPRAS